MLPGEHVLPLDVHVFGHENVHFVFDVRNFTILRAGPKAAAVLARMRDHALDAIINAYAKRMTALEVTWYYSQWLKKMEDGTLSNAPLPTPSRPPFKNLVLMLAGGCNMGCTYCFEKDVPLYQNRHLLKRDKADEILDWYCRYQEGPRAHLQLYGGEPLLNFEILRHVVERMNAWAGSRNVQFTKYLITNGTLLSPKRIEWLKEQAVELQVSVDGARDTHDRFRPFKTGQPTMKVIESNIQELIRQGARFNLRAVLTRQNQDPAAVLDALRALGTPNVSFEVVATDDPSTRLENTDWITLNRRYEEMLWRPFESWEMLPLEVQQTITRLCEKQFVFYKCGAGIEEVTIDPDGNIYDCQRIYRQPLSNVSDNKSPAQLSSGLLAPVDERTSCSDCFARYLCGGACMNQSYIGHCDGDPLPYYCEMRRNLVEASIAKVAEIRDIVPHGSTPDTKESESASSPIREHGT